MALTKRIKKLQIDAEVSEADIRETDYPPLAVLLEARTNIRAHMGGLDKQLEVRAKTLPGYTALWKPTSVGNVHAGQSRAYDEEKQIPGSAGMPRVAKVFSQIDVENKGYVTLEQIQALAANH